MYKSVGSLYLYRISSEKKPLGIPGCLARQAEANVRSRQELFETIRAAYLAERMEDSPQIANPS